MLKIFLKILSRLELAYLINPGEWHYLTPTLVVCVFQAYKGCSWAVNILIPQTDFNLTNIIGTISTSWNDMRLYATKLRKQTLDE